MHDIRWIRDNPDAFQERLTARGIPAAEVSVTLARLLELDEARRGAIGKAQTLQERRNAASKDIGAAKAAKDEARAQKLIDEVGTLKGELNSIVNQGVEIETNLESCLAEIPNLPLADVPEGTGEHENVQKSIHGTKPSLGTTKQHFEIGEALGGMDFETAIKLSGARFVVLKGEIARLERAIGQFMLDVHTQENGYTEVAVPLMVRDEVMFGTAQLPKFDYDQFKVTRVASLEGALIQSRDDIIRDLESSVVRGLAGRTDIPIDEFVDKFKGLENALLAQNYTGPEILETLNRALAGIRQGRVLRPKLTEEYWLIPTAEVPLTNLVRESILSEEELPLRFAALTPCFRAEAGAAGKDTRGMIRQHQFSKVELVAITTPEKSGEEHERMLAAAESVLKKLDLHYRVMTLCTGDMGFAAQKTYDIEVWLAGQGAYREISSVSVCGDFQARRMQARYRAGKDTRFVHTLNGSGVAVGRALIAVLENYQNADGTVTVPTVLRPYMGGLEKIGSKA